MNRFYRNLMLLGMFFVALFGQNICFGAEKEEAQDKPAEFFFYRCAGCHTVGGGKLTGPDLITSTTWSQADLKAAIKKMEKNVGPLTSENIDQLTEFLKDISVSSRIAKQKQKIEAKLRAELPPPSFEKGKKLFRGELRLQNGGPACITCHRFGNEGGSLGLDLTSIKDRVPATALQSAIENASYKIMRPIYEHAKITKEESLHLSEYLSNPDKIELRQAPSIDIILHLALLAFMFFMVIVWILNKNRKGCTREKLIQKSKKR